MLTAKKQKVTEARTVFFSNGTLFWGKKAIFYSVKMRPKALGWAPTYDKS